MNWAAVAVAAVGVFIVSTVYYTVFAEQLTAARAGTRGESLSTERPPVWKMAAEVVRSLVLAGIVAALSALVGVTDLASALALGVALWVAFPVILWTGAILWEGTPPRLAGVHAGDWLLKLLVISVVVGLWR